MAFMKLLLFQQKEAAGTQIFGFLNDSVETGFEEAAVLCFSTKTEKFQTVRVCFIDFGSFTVAECSFLWRHKLL